MFNKLCTRSVTWAIAFLMISAAASAQPATGSPAARGSESLGGQLLEDLDSAALRPASPSRSLPAGAPSGTRVEQTDPAMRIGPPLRFDDAGEDLGAPSGPLPLVRARQGMEQAGALLAQPGAVADARQVQQQVVAQLDELINQLCKQCQGGGNPSGQPKPQQSQRSQPKPGAIAKQPGVGAAPASDMTDPLNRTAAQPVDLADREELIKKLWGQLPQRSREQALQTFSTEFLPKYELELEKYYRRLAEEQDQQRPK